MKNDSKSIAQRIRKSKKPERASGLREVMQEDVLQLLIQTYPHLRRGMWRPAVMESFGGSEDSDILSECIHRLRYEPDAYAIELELRELVFFEVEVSSTLKRAKLQAYAAFAMELIGIVTFGVMTVNKHGHINVIDLLPHYGDWLVENTDLLRQKSAPTTGG